MISRRILILNGHPDPDPARLCSALVAAYAAGAESAGHQIRRIEVGAMTFPLIRSYDDFVTPPPCVIRQTQDDVSWAEHLVIVYPLWLGGVPAVLKGFLEQVFRNGFALKPGGSLRPGLLTGKSARLVVTMGMPAGIFRIMFGAFRLRAVERGLLWISGFRPIRDCVFGGAEAVAPAARRAWLKRMERLGARAI